MASTRKRLEALTAGLNLSTDKQPYPSGPSTSDGKEVLPPASVAPGVETRFPPAAGRASSPRTGPGQMLAFRGQALQVESELATLRERLAEYDGSLPTKKLDPERIHPSRWANRHDSSFSTSEFARLKGDIEQGGGNVQPILVRPLPSKVGEYELIFGHRRHRACKELKIPVLASIWTEDLGDAALFAAMDRENRERADLSNYEQGKMYQRALEEQLFPTQRKLAESLGVSHTWVRKALMVAQLPEAIVECFSSPLDITFRHAEQLNSELEKDRRGLLKRAEKVRGRGLSSSQVVARLLDQAATGTARNLEIRLGEQAVGSAKKSRAGEITIALTLQSERFPSKDVDAAVIEALRRLRQPE